MNQEIFFNAIRERPFGGDLSQEQVDGINNLLDALYRFPQAVPLPTQRAYVLATAWWETAHTMQPIREIGEGRGRAYGRPAGPYRQVYYGRGYVQLTWASNYQRVEGLLAKAGVQNSIFPNPDQALLPAYAGPILVLGMAGGWFSGRKLSQYLSEEESNWVAARWVVNGQDHASDIAQVGREFYSALLAAGDVNTSSAPVA